MPLPSSVRYEGEWFYVTNVAMSAPSFIGHELVSSDEWQCGGEASFKTDTGNLITVVRTLKQQCLTGALLVWTFTHYRIPPVTTC